MMQYTVNPPFSLEESKSAIDNFIINRPTTVFSASVELIDEYNGRVEIHLTNGDHVLYVCEERRPLTYRGCHPPSNGGCPPFVNVSLSINGHLCETDLDFLANYGSCIVSSVLSYYKNNRDFDV